VRTRKWAASIGGIDLPVEGIVTRMQLIVRYLSARKNEALTVLDLQMWACATLHALRRRGDP
jgi:hypothetical protein